MAGEVKLTKAQLNELEHLAHTRLPASWVKAGWPGFPESTVDGRVIGALQTKGYVERGVHYPPPYLLASVWWRITPAGRAALKSGQG